VTNLDLIMGAGSLLLAAATFWAGWIARIVKGETAAKEVITLRAEVTKVTADLADFKVHVAATYASSSTIEQMETRLVDAINRLGDRLDRVLERRPSRS
jgi:F0F1-type ATP synthase assembly protein I